MTCVAIGCASSVPVAVAAELPGRAIAGLGGAAAAVQGTQQVLRDNIVGPESHAIAARLSGFIRKLAFDFDSCTHGSQRREVFKAFVTETEEFQDSTVSQMIGPLRQGQDGRALPPNP